MPKYLDTNGLRTLWAQITNKISQESNTTAEALEGKADLVEGKIPASQLPSYVDDVLEYANKTSFPATGESGKIYLDLATNLTYRWGGTAYTEISPSLALGTTSSTAYRGDYGAAAYTHAVTNKGIAKTSGLYKITTNAEGHVTAATAVTKTDITGLGIPAQDTTYENATTTTNGLMSSTDKTKLNSIDLSALVKSVNGITPDSNGNIAIEVGGGTVSGEYLPLSGGTLSGWLTAPRFIVQSNDGYPAIVYNNADGNRVGELHFEASSHRFYVTQRATDTSYYENYILPTIATGLTENKTYNFLTTKTPVTIPQGGTGATTPEAARTALGITPANIGAAPTSHTHDSVTTSGCTLGIGLYNNHPLLNVLHGTKQAWAIEKEDDTYNLITHFYKTDGTWQNSGVILNSLNYSSYALPLTGGTIAGTLTINNSNSTGGFVTLMEDSEGGTIQIGSKTGAYTYEIDAYNDELLRVHTAVKNPNGGMKSLTWNGKSGNLTADGFTGSWLGNTIEINRGGTGATTPEAARTNLGITDANVLQTKSDSSTSTVYYLLANSTNTTTTSGTIFNKDLKANIKNGTASAAGFVELYLGNATASGTAGNKSGKLILYGASTGYHLISPSSVTSNITHTLPTISGTFINSGNYGSHIEFSNLKDIIVSTSTPTSVTNGKWYLVKQG